MVIGEQLTAHQQQQHQQQNHHQIQQQKQILPNTTTTQQQPQHHLTATVASVGLHNQLQHCRNSTATDVLTTTATATTTGASLNLANSSNINNPQPTPKKSNNNSNNSFNNNLLIINSYQSNNNTAKNISSTTLTSGSSVAASLATTSPNFPNVFNNNSINSNNGKVKNGQQILAGNINIGCNVVGNPNSNGITINNTSNNHINITTNNNSNNINNNINNIASTGGFACGVGGTTTTAIAAKSQLEQLNTMREALFSQDGWGCQHVNQDTNWEVPSSPEPTNKDPTGAPVMWKPTINNGTDLWETNLRNGGQPPAQPVQKTPWGHTPTSNLGGTWGEDDDGTDSSSVWAGSASNPNAGSGVNSAGVSGGGNGGGGPSGTGGPQWGQSAVGVGGANSSSGPNATNIGSVGTGVANNSTGVSVTGGTASSGGGGGASVGTSGNGWGDPRELRSGPMGGPLDMRSVDSMRAASAGDPRDIRLLDPRDPIRGDPRGISGRLNGTSEMWGQHHPIAAHNAMQGMNKIVGPGANAGSVGAAVVAANSGVNNIGPGGSLNVSNPVAVAAAAAAAAAAGNVSTQWGAAQSVVGPKDITSLTSGKQVTGWEEPSPPPQRRNIPNYDDGTSLWSQQSRVPGGGSHWKDISDRHIIRNTIGNQNASTVVGTSSGLVGGTQVGGIGSQGNVGATGNNPMGGVGPQNRLSAVGPSGVGVGGIGHGKPENTMWVHPSNNVAVGGRSGATWGDDNSHNVGVSAGGNNTNWVDDKPNVNISGQIGPNVGNTSSWNDTTACWNKNQNKITSGTSSAGWGTTTAANSGVGVNEANDLNSDWTSTTHSGMVPNKQQQQQQQKLSNTGVSLAGIGGGLNTDIIKQSKQYRILVDNGFKKDDVERALINANMNIEEAAEILRNNPSNIVMEGWRRHDETLGSYVDHANSAAGGGYSGRYPVAPTQPSITFPPNNILNNMGGSGAVGANGNNPNLTALNAMQPLQVQKYINQAQHAGVSSGSTGPQNVNAVAFGQNSTNVTNATAATTSNNQPSAQQLRMLVQQIQLAVHSGYLSSQILNQPLAPTTLLLLNQLLTSIKHLQGVQQSLGRGSNNMQIAKCKQTIQNLQNQINAQQAMYIKQQQQQQQQSMHQQQNAQQHTNVVTAGHVNNPNTEYIRGQHDAINALQNFGDISLNKTGGYQNSNQQSRLNQWKLPVLDKDLTGDGATDFSRAPGATKQNINAVTNVNNMGGPLGLQTDGTWSTGRNIGDGWPDTSVSSVTTATATATNDENKDWSVQEFEPGKPWKGPQIKNIEDDPSITPGSVARSPLSINSTPKEADIFSNASKNSPTDLPPLSLSSSTWSFNPTSNNQGFSSWSDNAQQCSTSELWATPTTMNKPTRGPPPGLIGTNKNVVGVGGIVNPNAVLNASSSNGWLAAGGRNGGTSNPGVLLSNSSGNVNWAGNSAPANSSNSNWNSNWLLLKNLTVQIDGATLRTLCRQHGPPITFHLYLNQGIALCKYATREEANKAQMTLNNCVLGNTTICAESPSETEVQSILQHLPQLQQQQVQQPSSTTATANSNVIGGGGVSGGGIGVVGAGNGNGASNTSNNHVATVGVGGVSTNCSNNSVSNANTAGNSVLNGNNGANVTNNNGTTSNNSNVAGNNAQNQNLSVATTGGGNSVGGGNSSNNVSVAAVSNNATINANANLPTANWRQTQQQQQNQTRPSGREADFDYISKYVCSIVDD